MENSRGITSVQGAIIGLIVLVVIVGGTAAFLAGRSPTTITQVETRIQTKVETVAGRETTRVATVTVTPTPPAELPSLVVAIGEDPAQLNHDPGTVGSLGNEEERMYAIFDGLTRLKRPDLKEVEPALATDWKVSQNGLVYTFNLRRGVKFHDGTPFNASAVEFSLLRTIQKSAQGKSILGPWIQSVKAEGEYTAAITLKQPFSGFLTLMSYASASIYSPSAVKKFGDDNFKWTLAGTGPFKWDSITPGVKLVLKRNPDYWGGAAKISQIIYLVEPDASTRRIKLEKGEINMISSYYSTAAPTDSTILKANPQIRIINLATPRTLFLVFQTQKEPWNNVKVRQALSYAINREAVVNIAIGGQGVPIQGPLTPVHAAYDVSIEKKYGYDPQLASKMLREAGIPEGFRVELLVLPDKLWQDIGTIVQDNLRAVGVRGELKTLDPGAATSAIEKGQFEIAVWGRRAFTTDPYFQMILYPTSSIPLPNFSKISDRTVDELFQQAATELDPSVRAKLYGQLQGRLVELAPHIWLATNYALTYVRSDVKELVPHFGQLTLFEGVYIQGP